MAECTFDQLLYALRVAVESANDGIRRRRVQQCARQDAADAGLHVEIPHGLDDEATLSPVVIPMRWFRDRRTPQITEFVIEFDCALRYRRLGGGSQLVADMSPRRAGWWCRPRLHRLRIALRAAEAWQPSVSLDGRIVPFPIEATR